MDAIEAQARPSPNYAELLYRRAQLRPLRTADRMIGEFSPTLKQLDIITDERNKINDSLGIKHRIYTLNDLPEMFDLRQLNRIMPARPSGQANNDCWAWCTIAAAQSSIMTLVNTPAFQIEFSIQDIISCSKAGTAAAGGHAAFEYLATKYIYLEKDYPYRGSDLDCQNPQTPRYKAAAWGYLNRTTSGFPNRDDVKSKIIQYGALHAAMYATGAFQEWENKGPNDVFKRISTPNVGSTNHAVAICGWDDSKQAWLIRNSWGAGWGYQGFTWIGYHQNSISYAASWVQMQKDPVPST
jgi:C1A family cysteine protease